ncbi:MAG TPA: hypothetical protein VMV83_18220 [Rectinemataceae bacterium]|nr:hypothetical protein [Rectinemataceae bacterium]
MNAKKRKGRAAYILAILAASLGFDWGFSHILDAHRSPQREPDLRRSPRRKP